MDYAILVGKVSAKTKRRTYRGRTEEEERELTNICTRVVIDFLYSFLLCS